MEALQGRSEENSVRHNNVCAVHCVYLYSWRRSVLASPERWVSSGAAVCPGRRLHGEEFCPTRSLGAQRVRSGLHFQKTHSRCAQGQLILLSVYCNVKMASFEYIFILFFRVTPTLSTKRPDTLALVGLQQYTVLICSSGFVASCKDL